MALALGASHLLPRSTLRPADAPASLCGTSVTYFSSRGHQSNAFAVSSDPSSSAPPPPPPPKKPTFTMKKGDIVRVDREKYLQSVEYLAVGHPPYFKGIDYIYEDRGEVLNVRMFEAGEYALIGWAGIPTSPAWLPSYMLIKSEKLSYKRT